MGRRRRKPRLFSFSREVELAHCEEMVHTPEDRRALEALVDAFIAICHVHAVTADTLLPIARAAKHSSPFVRGVGVTRLAVLCHYFSEAHAVMEQVCRDKDEGVRLYAVAALTNVPESVGVLLLSLRLEDESWRVRKAAAQAARAVAWPSLIPELTRHLTTEADARVRVVLQMAIDFQRQHQRELL